MLSLLRPMDPSGYDPHRACMDGTREVVLSKIMTWTQNRDTSEKLMWICGQIGMGKTAIATSLCQRLDKTQALAGSFFCQRDDPSLSDPLRMINNLVHDIALRCPAYAEQVAYAIRANRTLCSSHLGLRYEGLIKGPLEKLKSLRMRTTLVVVIDGFDECGDHESQQHVLQLVYDMSRLVPWLKVVITARPTGNLQDIFQSLCIDEQILHLQTYDAAPDIHTYVRAKLGRRAHQEQWPANSIEGLCDLAEGVFVWAATAVKYLAKSNFPALPRLQKVLSNSKSVVTDSLDSVYMKALKGIIDDEEPEVKAVYLRCIGAILATSGREPLSIPDLQYLLLVAGDLDQLTLELIVRNLAPLLLQVGGNRLRAYHTSFRDFIASPLRSDEYHIQLDKYEADPAACCLRVMQRDLRFNMCKLETSHLLNSEVSDLGHRIQSNISLALQYACVHWIDHFISSPNNTLVEMLKQLMEGPQVMYWIEALSLLGRLDVALAGLSKLAELQLDKLDSWNVIASWAKDAHRFVLTFYSTIDASTPHLYISALAFAPGKSLTTQRMRRHFPNTISIAGSAGSGWHPCVKAITHIQDVQSFSLFPDASKAAVGYSNGSLGIWDMQTGNPIGEILVGHQDSVTCAAVSSDGDLVASGSYDTTVRVHSMSGSLKSYQVLAGHSGPVHTVAFSPDCTLLASGSSDKTIHLWDARSFRPVRGPYAGHSSRVTCVEFSRDGTKLVSGSWDKTIRIWSVDLGGQQLANNPLVISGHSDLITHVVFSPDGSKIVSGSTDGALWMWNTNNGTKVRSETSTAERSDTVTSICYSPDGRYVASASINGKIKVHDANTLESIGYSFGHLKAVSGLGFVPNSSYLVSGSTDRTIRVWDMDTCPKVMDIPPFVGHSSGIWSISLSKDGTRLISGSSDNTLRMWDTQTGAQIGSPFTGHSSYVYGVAISPDATRVVSGPNDNSLKLWHTATHAAIRSYQHTHHISCVTFSPDGALVAFGSGDFKVYLWEVAGWKIAGTALQAHSNSVSSVAFSPDGATLASGSADNTVVLWNVAARSRIGNPLSGHTGRVRSVAFSPCGTWLASGSHDMTVRVWEVKTGNVIRELKGHSNLVMSVAFSPNGAYTASGSVDQTVRLWNAKTGQPAQQILSGHSHQVNSIAFSPNGSHILSGSYDSTIRAWNIDPNLIVNQPNDPPNAFAWPASPYELSPHPDHLGWVSHDQRSLAFWLPPYYQQPESFPGSRSQIYYPRVFLDYSKFVHGTAWTNVATDSIKRSSG
ncbi:hypothetical protein BN14_06530 [Rhizoctonia solani AG-1 IB]|uniref:Uncharacterized protein n=1 Tax=Thanatephorus cucumeris (strain AG1-IB / isolate 7/3/14) TaxID=1108050 RepID=M5C0J1_THACB|nr:hypothetical protein BN14_06530 [Rhizoctonia solani AG-1 IB]